MDDFDNLPAMAPVAERDFSGFAPAHSQGDIVPMGGMTMIQQSNRDTTARRVAVARDPGKVFAQINAFCGQFGDQYVYSWQVKNRRESRMDTIEGGTIKLANMLARAYGNCQVDCDVTETKTHYILKAFFIDFETGLSMSRLFQQRKSQNTGMADADRQADIIFQIGQSKAIRNVILNVLSDFSTHAIEQSKSGLLKKFASEEARAKAHEFIELCQERFDVSGIAVDAVVGRARREWTIPNLARAYMLMRGVYDGLTSANEAFPTDDIANDMIEGQAAEKQEVRSTKRATAAKPKADSKKDEPKQETQPQHNAELAEAFLKSLDEADNFERIQELRGDIAKAGKTGHFDDGATSRLSAAYDTAMARVKADNARNKAKPAADTFPGDLKKGETLGDETRDDAIARHRTEELEQISPSEVNPEFDEEAALDRIDEMFSDLDVIEDVESTRDMLVKVIARLSEAGARRAQLAYKTAQNRAKDKAKQVTAGPATSTQLFGDD